MCTLIFGENETDLPRRTPAEGESGDVVSREAVDMGELVYLSLICSAAFSQADLKVELLRSPGDWRSMSAKGPL